MQENYNFTGLVTLLPISDKFGNYLRVKKQQQKSQSRANLSVRTSHSLLFVLDNVHHVTGSALVCSLFPSFVSEKYR